MRPGGGPFDAGRAAEELAYGLDEMTSINQGKLVLARRIVQKLVASAALNDELGPRTLAYDSGIKGRRKYLLVPETVMHSLILHSASKGGPGGLAFQQGTPATILRPCPILGDQIL